MSKQTDTAIDSTVNFSAFGEEFQLTLIRIILQDISFFNKIKDIIHAEYFDNVYLKKISAIILKYVADNNVAPNKDNLAYLINQEEAILIKKTYLKKIDDIFNQTLEQRVFVEKEALNFCRDKHSKKYIDKALDLVMAGKRDEAKKFALEAFKYDHADYKLIDMKENISILSKSTTNNAVPCLFPEFNRISQGGPGNGRLCIQVAQSHFGKTTSICAYARNAAVEGYDGIFFSLEDDEETVLRKIVAGMVGIDFVSLAEHPLLIKQTMEKIKGNIKIVHFRATGARLSNFANVISELKSQGFFPKWIVIDGLNQVKPDKGMRFESDNDKYEYFCEYFRDMAGDEQIPIWANFQSNRGGFNNLEIDEKNIGKAIEVFQVADFVIIYAQDRTMAANNECYALLFKNRLGPSKKGLRIRYNLFQGLYEEAGPLQDLADIFNRSQADTQVQSIQNIRERLGRRS